MLKWVNRLKLNVQQMIKKAIYKFIGRKLEEDLGDFIQTVSAEIKLHYGFEDPKVDECSAKIIIALMHQMKYERRI